MPAAGGQEALQEQWGWGGVTPSGGLQSSPLLPPPGPRPGLPRLALKLGRLAGTHASIPDGEKHMCPCERGRRTPGLFALADLHNTVRRAPPSVALRRCGSRSRSPLLATPRPSCTAAMHTPPASPPFIEVPARSLPQRQGQWPSMCGGRAAGRGVAVVGGTSLRRLAEIADMGAMQSGSRQSIGLYHMITLHQRAWGEWKPCIHSNNIQCSKKRQTSFLLHRRKG